jgi:methylmalonyl-CoA mutase
MPTPVAQPKPAPQPYKPQHPVRFVTAAALFDGHDAAINIMRRILQSSGAEVVHLGHNRSVAEIVETAVAEDAQGIAISSYQGGHVEFFKYLVDTLRDRGYGHVRVYGGGGGVIVPDEIADLESHGVAKIFSPEDGRLLGLQGMIDQMLRECDTPLPAPPDLSRLRVGEPGAIGRAITYLEAGQLDPGDLPARQTATAPVVLGITGTGGAGKSSLVDELVRRFLQDQEDKTAAILSVDPTQRRSGGALLGDRIRMNSIYDPRVYMRSLATRVAHVAMSATLPAAIGVCKAAGFDLIIVETAGIGQSDSQIADLTDLSIYVMTTDYGAPSQLEKIEMLAFADLVVINKFDKRGADDALRDVRKQVQRNQGRFSEKPEEMSVFGTIASQFNDYGTNWFYASLIRAIARKTGMAWEPNLGVEARESRRQAIIPPERVRYLSEISEAVRSHHDRTRRNAERASEAGSFWQTLKALGDAVPAAAFPYEEDELLAEAPPEVAGLRQRYNAALGDIGDECAALIRDWASALADYTDDQHHYVVRGKRIDVDNYVSSLSGTRIPKVAMPRLRDWGDILAWQLRENVPGRFPYAAGVFEYKRTAEDPIRMFAGEGTPERTNKRFHYLAKDQLATRLSTAFDSVTLYGEDPAERPDICGKVGNSGVSICSVDDMRKLYSGFDLSAPTTSVSMTINGPAPMILAMFFNGAVDQQVEKHLIETGRLPDARRRISDWFGARGLQAPEYTMPDYPEGEGRLGLATLGFPSRLLVDEPTYQRIRQETLASVRGTVQADILKEDQAQNTCIFSTEFALRMMGDIQQFFIDNAVRNFYSVSISGYHIAEAGANPITQLAFTLANGFTYVEYYRSRGMNVDDFAPNLSFFFSNGLDPEYAVIGRVARRIWAIAMRDRYGANERSQKLKYHIQTSGRSLHAQEIDFNDIRTTLQAVYAIFDNCNSLHTNAYDEAITTPTEESVRRAMAIQLIINRELGMARNENPLQGSHLIDQLTDLVEEAVLLEFDRLTERGGVLGAMELMYQRGKIQEESLHYEHLKHSGELPIIGVNTFLNPHARDLGAPELIRSTEAEKRQQIESSRAFQLRNRDESGPALQKLRQVAVSGGNLFAELMDCVQVCTLGQISQALYEVGGQYRRAM